LASRQQGSTDKDNSTSCRWDIILFTQCTRESLSKSQGDAFNTLVRNQTLYF